MRVELLLKLSALSRQEIIVIKACAPDAKSFESVAATLVERSLGQPNLRNSGHLQTRSGRGTAQEDFNEASCPAFDKEAAPGYPEDPESDGEDYKDYELSESEAIALNCLEELEDSSEAGHAVQLQVAAHAAFGKAKGKGARLFVVT